MKKSVKNGMVAIATAFCLGACSTKTSQLNPSEEVSSPAHSQQENEETMKAQHDYYRSFKALLSL